MIQRVLDFFFLLGEWLQHLSARESTYLILADGLPSSIHPRHDCAVSVRVLRRTDGLAGDGFGHNSRSLLADHLLGRLFRGISHHGLRSCSVACVYLTLCIVQLIPYDVFALLGNNELEVVRLLRLLRLIKLLWLFRLHDLLSNFEIDFPINYNVITLIKFFSCIVYLTHIIACGYVLVTVLESYPVSWITESGFEGAEDGTIYVAAMYYAATLVSTIGFGGIASVTPAEQVH